MNIKSTVNLFPFLGEKTDRSIRLVSVQYDQIPYFSERNRLGLFYRAMLAVSSLYTNYSIFFKGTNTISILSYNLQISALLSYALFCLSCLSKDKIAHAKVFIYANNTTQ